MNVQTLIVVLCVLAAAAYLLRPVLRRWFAPRKAGTVIMVGTAPSPTSGSACGGCKGCASTSSSGCH